MPDTAGQIIRCKAAVAWEPGKPLVIEEIEVHPPQRNEVRVKIIYASLCHSDINYWEAKTQLPIFPRIYGHESGGIVESVGEGVTHLAPGDHVLPLFTGECGECPDCKSKDSMICRLLKVVPEMEVMRSDGKHRFFVRGQPIPYYHNATFSEYTVVDARCCPKINPLAPLDTVQVLSCGVTTGLGAALNLAKPFKGSTVAIFGLGTIGLAAAEGSRIAGASRIIGVDVNPAKFEQAKNFGITEFVNPKDYDRPVQEVLKELTGGDGVDRSIECSGNLKAMEAAFGGLRSGWGVAVLVGIPPKDAVLSLKPEEFIGDVKTLKGTTFGNYKPLTDIPILVEKYMNKEIDLDKFITHRVPFSEINKAFEYLLKGESLRCAIEMGA